MPRKFFSYPMQDPKKERKPVIPAWVQFPSLTDEKNPISAVTHTVDLGFRGLPESVPEKKGGEK